MDFTKFEWVGPIILLTENAIHDQLDCFVIMFLTT